MPRTVALAVASAALALGSFADVSSQAADAERFWPQWRGPHFKGVSTTANPPITWSETKNIAWKAPLPGRGNSTPVIWGDRLFVTSAVPAGVTGEAQHTPRGGLPQRGMHRFVVLAIDRKTGKTVWERTAREQEPHEALALRERHLGVGLAHHRRAAPLRLLRVVRALRVRHEREAALGEGPRRQADAERVRRRAPRRCSIATRWWSCGTT